MDRPDFEAALARTAHALETHLAGLLGHAPRAGESARPRELIAAMRYSALGGGKRLRPFLVVESAALFGLAPARALQAAAALECVHCYSLVHDDLPAMDDDDLRRGRPTTHIAFDEATAILAGDALLTYAFEIMADPATDPDPEIRCALVVGLARASGLAGMAGGQMLDLVAEKVTSHAADQVALLQAMKTGALIAFACEAGAVLGRASGDERAALKAYGTALGEAFQIADDLLDLEGSAEETGKAVAKDAGRGKATLVSVLGADAARLALAEATGRAVAHLSPFGARADTLRAAARFLAQRRG